MSYELECAYEDLDLLQARLALAIKLIEQYRAEIRNRTDLLADGFCQGAWFEDNYRQVVKE